MEFLVVLLLFDKYSVKFIGVYWFEMTSYTKPNRPHHDKITYTEVHCHQAEAMYLTFREKGREGKREKKRLGRQREIERITKSCKNIGQI